MHLAKFAPKLTLFPHQSISRGWKIDTSKNGPWKPKLPPFGKKSQTKSIPEEDAFRACSSRIERTRDARNGEKKRAPTRPTTPASAPRSHGSPGLRKTPLRNQTPDRIHGEAHSASTERITGSCRRRVRVGVGAGKLVPSPSSNSSAGRED